MTTPSAPQVLDGRLAENVMLFGRVLRRAGLAVGTDRIQLALNALAVAGLGSRQDFQATLAACFVDRVEHRELFDQAFALFWREPGLSDPLLAAHAKPPQTASPVANQRLSEALFPPLTDASEPPAQKQETETVLAWNERERLHEADFETMSADEWRQAQAMLKRLAPLFEPLATRRMQRAPHPGRMDGRIDGRATLQAMARHGGELWEMRWRRPRRQPAPLVVLADISGSMSRYSRMLLHFTHALGHAEARVESFVFGTRLTRTTRSLRQRDPDIAVAQVAREVQDWAGGTRISECLRQFNRQWARRVLPGRATVLLITDGLEHGHTEALGFEMERLHKSCRRLIWLNPLLRFDAFEPRASGIKAMLPHVDRFLPAHNLQSLEQLAQVLAGGDAPGRIH